MRGGFGRPLLSKRMVLRLNSPSRGGNEQFETSARGRTRHGSSCIYFDFRPIAQPFSGRPAKVIASEEFGARNVTRTLSIDRSKAHCKERPS
jgi:hypothetical protein